jgi:hypothetical protein
LWDFDLGMQGRCVDDLFKFALTPCDVMAAQFRKPAMLMLLDIPSEFFDRLLDGIGVDSPIYRVLMNSVVMYDREPGMQRIVRIVCDKSEVEVVLDAAKRLCPEAVAEIEPSVRSSPEF